MSETEDYDKSATPTAHKTTHQDGGTDEISVQGLAGLLADGQTPLAHKTSHQDTGTDEISVTGLSGTLADDQHIIDSEAVSAMGTKANSNPLNHDRYADSEALAAAVQAGAITDGVTKAPTHDAVYDVAALLLDHSTRHEDGGLDEISAAGLTGVLADDQHIIDSEAVSAMGAKANSNPLNHDRYADSEALAAAVQAGAITDGVTKAPTHDAVYDVKVMTEGHKTRHQDGGSDEISVAGLSGVLADPQTPIALPKFSAHKNGTNQTGIVTTTWTKITFQTEDYDIGSTYDAVNSKWVPGIVGKAHIDAALHWTTALDQGWLITAVYINGNEYKRNYFRASGTDSHSGPLSCDIPIQAITDYVEIYGIQGSGSDKVVFGHSAFTWFSGHMLV
jgi:hypothetical protein